MDRTYEEDICALALNTAFGFQPRVSMTLIRNLGSAAAAFSLTQDQLKEVLGPYSAHSGKITEEAFDSAAIELESLRKDGYDFIHVGMDCYPQTLLECDDAPVGLYVHSKTDLGELFNIGPYIAIVGTRDISQYGREFCERIVRALADAPTRPVIVSGLALGVDIVAHRTALDCGLGTIGVSPTGIRDVYPISHRKYAAAMADARRSGIITDYPPGTAPIAINFIRRNRIIAGLSRATILIESKVKGGGMMTARFAAGYGRDVFCLPGRLDDLRSQGCNELIAENFAECIFSVDSLADALGLGKWSRRKKAGLEEELRRRYAGRDSLEAIVAVAIAIKKERGICPDEICDRLKLDYSEVLTIIGELESDGIIVTDLLRRCAIDGKIG